MSQIYHSRKREAGQHLNYSDRQLIEYVYHQNQKLPRYKQVSQKKLADQLTMSPSTLSRELKRGQVRQKRSDLSDYWAYSADVAQRDYDEKASHKGPNLKLGHDYALAEHIENRLLGIKAAGTRGRRYSPDAVIMELEEQGWPFATKISTRTLYSYIEKDVFATVTQKDLPRGGDTKRHKRLVARRAHTVPDGRQIEDRPREAEERLEAGHWEMDCIESVKRDKTCLLTLVDRCTRDAKILKLRAQTQKAVDRALNGLERKMGAKYFRETFKTITIDNGSEFWDWKTLETSVLTGKARTVLYYAHPYSSWERGSNENLNGFIRYWIPKGSELRAYTRKEIEELEHWINHYPRRILGGKSAAAFAQVS